MLDQLPERVPAQLFTFAGGIDDFHCLAKAVVSIARGLTKGIDFADAVATRVVPVLPNLSGGIGFHQWQRPMLQPHGGFDTPQRILRLAQVAGLVITERPLTALRVGGAEQLALVIPVELPGLAEVVGVLGDLVLGIPPTGADPLQTIGNLRDPSV